MTEPNFKSCPCCDFAWNTRDAFLSDQRICLNGYQADFEELERGLLLFTHEVSACGSTMALSIGDFVDMCDVPRHTECLHATGTCECRCDDVANLERCERPCQYAYPRELVQIVLTRSRDLQKCH